MEASFLSHLLPYDPEIKVGKKLENGLREYLLLLIATEEAMQAFLEGELNKFDPLVGENSCQIRAIRMALIASKISFDIMNVLGRVGMSKKFILDLIESVEDPSICSKSLKHFLKCYNLDIPLNEDAVFLIKSYILSKVKVGEESQDLRKKERTVSKKIKEFTPVGSTFADDLIRFLRQKLSKSSSSFIQKVSACPLLDSCIEDIIREFTALHKGLHITPFYWMTKVFLHHAQVSKIPIVVLAEQFAQDLENQVLEKTTLFFRPSSSGYQLTSRDHLSLDEPIIVFIVASCRNASDFPSLEDWERDLTELSLEDLVLACNAAHRQCPDPVIDQLLKEIEDEEFLYHLEKSQEWGCHMENPSRFILRHIYCDHLKNI